MPFFCGDRAPASPWYVLRELLYVYQLVLTLSVVGTRRTIGIDTAEINH